ncbi:MAG TPA: 2'-5' RNA ligase family protein [Chloroflexota bacterium]|nr:2'-5' RNA ligase family protein [Chloroflexota bacterium]
MRVTDYDRFSIVAFAPPDVRERVDALRRQLPPSGRPIMQAHVTLKGTFVEPYDLDVIVSAIERTCAAAEPFRLTTTGIRVFTREGGGVGLAIQEVEPFFTLHRRLAADLQPLCRTIYEAELTGDFHPHLTIVQQLPANAIDPARAAVEAADLHIDFAAEEASLVGRRNGQVWETLRAFPIGSR